MIRRRIGRLTPVEALGVIGRWKALVPYCDSGVWDDDRIHHHMLDDIEEPDQEEPDQNEAE